jgi:Tfp pilus assembly protein PilV
MQPTSKLALSNQRDRRDQRSRRNQRGTSLLEALVAFLVLSLGMLSVARLQGQFRMHADTARQRSEAVRLAQQELETLRAFSVMGATAGSRSYADIAPASATLDGAAAQAGSNTRYTIERGVSDNGLPNAKSASVRVLWEDRSGTPQQVFLATVIAGIDPAYSGALGIAPNNATHKGALARSAAVPVWAKDLGNGSSVSKPVAAGGVALVFNNRSGLITARCTGVATSSTTSTLQAGDLVACDTSVGRLLSGHVRFSAASPPDPAHANDSPAPLGIVLSTSGGTYPAAPQCTVEAQKTVRVSTTGGTRTLTVAIDATPASLGFAAWQETGERFASYTCVVYPMANGQWSGRMNIVPSGWTLGSGPGDWRVCRFSADLDGSGAVDSNAEHPAAYHAVDTALANQNFLVVRGSEACPIAAASSGFVDLSTAAHQP